MSKLSRQWLVGLCCLLGLAALPAGVWAQTSGIRLSMSRDWGFSQGRDIQGKFTLAVTGPSDLASAVFYIDGREIGVAGAPPLRLAFDTGNYSAGEHKLSATARTAGGQTLQDEVTVNILNIAQVGQQTQRIVVPLIAVVVAGMVGSVVLGSRRSAERPGLPRSYVPLGGAICPHCNRPLALSMLGVNLVTGKLQRCPYCRKWALMRRAGPAVLAAAEAAEVAASQPNVPAESAQEKLRRQIEESRYQ